MNLFWLVVSTQLKIISQNGNLPQIGVKIKNIWNHHLVFVVKRRIGHMNQERQEGHMKAMIEKPNWEPESSKKPSNLSISPEKTNLTMESHHCLKGKHLQMLGFPLSC